MIVRLCYLTTFHCGSAMKVLLAVALSSALFLSGSSPTSVSSASAASSASPTIFGFRDAAAEQATESQFLAVPDSKLAEEHLRILTKVPHMAGTIEDKATADYVAQKFRAAGLDTEIVEYKVWMNYPSEISVDLIAPAGVEMHGPRASTSITTRFKTIPAWSCPSAACRLRATSNPTWSTPTTARRRTSRNSTGSKSTCAARSCWCATGRIFAESKFSWLRNMARRA
jgi:hypothetical protein